MAAICVQHRMVVCVQVAILAKMLQETSQAVGDWRMVDLPDLLNKFETQTARKTLFSIAFF